MVLPSLEPHISIAVTVIAGIQWHEVYMKLDDANQMMVGGVTNGGSVGAAGGWIQGGGHSNLSPSYGLGMPLRLALFLYAG